MQDRSSLFKSLKWSLFTMLALTAYKFVFTDNPDNEACLSNQECLAYTIANLLIIAASYTPLLYIWYAHLSHLKGNMGEMTRSRWFYAFVILSLVAIVATKFYIDPEISLYAMLNPAR